jgi:DNA modification methylase
MTVTILKGDCRDVLRTMESESVHCVVTSPPYFGLRDYGVAGQIGLEATPDAFVDELVDVFREVRRILRADGTCWLNLGDSYAGGGTIGRNDTTPDALARRAAQFGTGTGRGSSVGSQGTRARVANLKAKDLIGVPWRVAFALQADGWYLRQDIIWSKPNPMPESIRDRCTKSHEYLFLLSKSPRYFYDIDAVKEDAAPESAGRYNYDFNGSRGAVICPGDAEGQRTRPDGKREFDGKRNKRSVWEITTQPFADAHFATFPPALIEPCILAGCPIGGTVLDPFGGAGTTGLVADRLQRNAVLIELNPEYATMAERRIQGDGGMFASVALTSTQSESN